MLPIWHSIIRELWRFRFGRLGPAVAFHDELMCAGCVPEIAGFGRSDIYFAHDRIAPIHAHIAGFIVAVAGAEKHAATGNAPAFGAIAEIDSLHGSRVAASGKGEKHGGNQGNTAGYGHAGDSVARLERNLV